MSDILHSEHSRPRVEPADEDGIERRYEPEREGEERPDPEEGTESEAEVAIGRQPDAPYSARPAMMPDAVLGASGAGAGRVSALPGTETPDTDPDAEVGDEHEHESHVPGTAPADGSASVADVDTALPDDSAPESTEPDADGPVLAPDAATHFRERWREIQAAFIDDPRRAVLDADRFAGEVAQAVASGVEQRRRALTPGSQDAAPEHTEELRLTMRQYRVLVDRILRV